MPSKPVELEVFADIACPWCLVGHTRLARALEAFPPGAVRVRHRAFQLRPELPASGVPARDLYARKFGSWERARATFAAVEAQARADGIALDLGAIETAPNTRLAHRAVALAAEQGAELAALDALLRACLCEGRDVTREAVVIERLRTTGIPDPDALAASLEGGGGERSVDEDARLAAELDVTAVPLFVADRGFGLPGAQPAALLVKLIRHAAGAGVAGPEVNPPARS
ncbi:MAG: DsbA family oxidoreductase [Solirubrobacteraceae bacterium]